MKQNFGLQQERGGKMEELRYEKPEMEIIYFETEDVITTSGGVDGFEETDPDW